jgi:AcrR family transcriptional regulator
VAPRPPTPRRLAAIAAQRRRVLDAASRRLAAGGVDGLNVRDLGAAVGASSTVVYTLFGGRDELLLAVFQDALDQLADAIARASSPDPLRRLIEMAHAYRRFAVAHPHVYSILLVTEPRLAARRLRDSRALQLVADGVTRCIDRGVFAPGDPRAIADIMWAMLHGIVSLELAGYFPDPEVANARFLHAGVQIFTSFFPRAP